MSDNEDNQMVPINSATSTGGTKESLSDFATKEVTKATISQSIGTLIYPFTRELAALNELGITKLKDAIKDRKRRKLAERNLKTINEIEVEVENNLDKAEKVQKLHSLFEEATKCDLDKDEMIVLWSSLIERLKEDDKDYEYLLNILKTITPSEAEYLLSFYEEGIYVDVNPTIKALSFKHHLSTRHQRYEQIADTLKEKNLVEQPLPIIRIAMVILSPMLALLVGMEVGRPFFEKLDINVSSANIAFLIGIVGILMGISLLGVLKKPTRLTWVGQKLYDGGMKVMKREQQI